LCRGSSGLYRKKKRRVPLREKKKLRIPENVAVYDKGKWEARPGELGKNGLYQVQKRKER